jgi:hypothetical protein
MRLLERVLNTENLQPVEVARFTNAAARMMDVYQAGCLTLQKLKSGGTQRVEVQYQQVNVGSGGQAVVAGRVGGLANAEEGYWQKRTMNPMRNGRRGWLKNGNPPGDWMTAPRCGARTRHPMDLSGAGELDGLTGGVRKRLASSWRRIGGGGKRC